MPFPTGAIVLWSGAIGTIPDGYLICDGTWGTPDLRDKFIVGAGDTYNPSDSGGSIQHTHDFTGDGHIHDIPAGSGLQTGVTVADETASSPATGTTDNTNHLPPYYALAYIMKT